MSPEEKGVLVKASKGKFMMPYCSKKDFVEYASLGRNKVIIVGLGPCFEIWNREKLDEFLEPADF
jgi:DNA-binding transcriptional regulator/RsmH inhibitor MraZ